MRPERRRETRHVVDGLTAELDGVAHEILDISASGVRLLRLGMTPAAAALRLEADDPADGLDVTVAARFQRATPLEVVYRYDPPAAGWAERLAGFDVFADLSLDVWDDADGSR